MRKYRFEIIVFIFLLFIIAMSIMGPIPQDLEYHDFADTRNYFGIPNFWNVASNIPMFFLGIFGIAFSVKTWNSNPGLVSKLIPLLLSIGILGAFFGSSYYHWAPDNNSLVWDRLPMTLMFMPLFALLIYDFIGRRAGEVAFYLLIPIGILSIFYWQYSESIGQGDLRLYVFVQFFPIIIVPFIIWLFPKQRTYIKYIIYILVWYILAKLAEQFDDIIFDSLQFWSGHTIKHLLASVALFYILLLLKEWNKTLAENN